MKTYVLSNFRQPRQGKVLLIEAIVDSGSPW